MFNLVVPIPVLALNNLNTKSPTPPRRVDPGSAVPQTAKQLILFGLHGIAERTDRYSMGLNTYCHSLCNRL